MQKTTTTPKSMRKDQIEYVRSRAEAILESKKRKIRKNFEVAGRSLNSEEKLKALQDGRFTVDTKGDLGWRSEWWYKVTFIDEHAPKFDHEGYEQATESLRTEYTKLIDELMIGDNTQALALLRAFEDRNDEI